MALLLADSLDYANQTDFKRVYPSGSANTSFRQTGYETGYCMRYVAAATMRGGPLSSFGGSSFTEFIFGVVVGGYSVPIYNRYIVQFYRAGGMQCAVSINPSGYILVQRGGTVLATGTVLHADSGWHYLTVELKIDNSKIGRASCRERV